MLKNLGFRKQLSISFALISFTSILICGGAAYVFTSQLVRRLTIEGLQQQIAGTQGAIDVSQTTNLQRGRILIERWAPRVDAQITVGAETETIRAENQTSHEKTDLEVPALRWKGRTVDDAGIDELSNQVGSAVTIFAYTEQGLVRLSTSLKRENGTRANGTYIPTDSPIYKSIANRERYLGRAELMGKPYITAYEPILRNDKVVGAFFIGNEELSQGTIRDYLKKQKLLETGYFFILNPQGQMVMHPALEGKNVLDMQDTDGKFLFKDLIARKSGFLEYNWKNATSGEIQKKILIFKEFPQQGWIVAASVIVSEAEAPLKSLQVILASIVCVLTMIVAGVAVAYSGMLVRRLLAVSEGLESASGEVRASSTSLTSISEALTAVSDQQSSSIQSTSVALEEIRATVSRNVEATRATQERSTEMSRGAMAGKEVLGQLSNTVSEIAAGNAALKTEIGETQRRFNDIALAISNIEEKTQVINEIVFQTKLLSFNASVEAARAGEHGKGFAVVAEEVGRLAEMSGKSADEIRKSLTDNRQQVDHIVKETNTRMASIVAAAASKVESGVRIAAECQVAFDEILARISETDIAVTGISQSSHEQAQGINEIANAVVTIETKIEENAKIAAQTKEFSKGLLHDADDLSRSIGDLRRFTRGGSNAA